ncbi:MAG TPA: hypothetical protein VF134_06300 [Candidatus Dormibacteraeota bacterium]
MIRPRRLMVGALFAASMFGSGVAGAAIATALNSPASIALAASNSPSPAATTAPSGTPPNGGKFVPNEDPTHEAGESAAREAQENAGQRPTVP